MYILHVPPLQIQKVTVHHVLAVYGQLLRSRIFTQSRKVIKPSMCIVAFIDVFIAEIISNISYGFLFFLPG